MLKQIAWNTFKKTGNIDTFMELLEVDKAMDNMKLNNVYEQQNDNFYSQDNKVKQEEQKWEL